MPAQKKRNIEIEPRPVLKEPERKTEEEEKTGNAATGDDVRWFLGKKKREDGLHSLALGAENIFFCVL